MSIVYTASSSSVGHARWSAQRHHFSVAEQALGDLLISLDQAHLFSHWPEQYEDELAAKQAFFSQIAQVEKDYIGGSKAYVSRAQVLLQQALTGANPYEGYNVSPAANYVRLETNQDIQKYEAIGFEHVAETGFVIVAGGLGERLGYAGIKLSLPQEISTELAYIENYILNILALQHKLRIKLNKPHLVLPLAIMTSDDTDTLTRQLLTTHKNFGMTPEQLTIFKQGKVPSLSDNAAHFVLEEKNPYQLDTKPHGHGDVHSLLFANGIIHDWVQNKHVKWVLFFQDTNGLVFHAFISALGVSVEKKLHMNSITVPRAQGDAVGAICTLKREEKMSDDNSSSSAAASLPNPLTINVEYNQLEGLLGKGVKEPTIPGTNYSIYPGNINVLLYHAPSYLHVLEKKGGQITEFVNPKYNADKQSFKKPTRLECMMQDYPKLLDNQLLSEVSDDFYNHISFTQFQRWTSFSAVKNALVDGVAKQQSGNAPESASSGESDIYHYYYLLLKAHGVPLAPPAERNCSGIKVLLPPRIVFYPSVGVTQQDVLSHFPQPQNIHISNASTFIVDAENVVFHQLHLNGTLVIFVSPDALTHNSLPVTVHVDGLTVENKGWEFVDIAANQVVDPKYAIRGYTLHTQEQTFLTINAAAVQAHAQLVDGQYVVKINNENVKAFEKQYAHPARR